MSTTRTVRHGNRSGATTRSDSLERFAADVQALRGAHGDQRALADEVARRLAHLLGDPDWLPEAHRLPGQNHYRQHVLYVAPDGGFSVVSLVWRPGQKTAIHDHVSWCVVGVYQGLEEETRYLLYEDERERFLAEAFHQVASPGRVVALVPPDEDIHEVANCGDGLAISIHVYGADIQRLGTSINHRFDHLPIRAEAGTAHPVAWRPEVGRTGKHTRETRRDGDS